MDRDARSPASRFVIHDRDTQFSRSCDAVVRAEGATLILTPIRAPNATAHAERLDGTLILARRHLDRTLRTYAEHDNRGRPHRALTTPLAAAGDRMPVRPRDVRRRDLRGGLIHEYHGLAA